MSLNIFRLEVILFKLETSSWPIVVPGDTRGEMVVDEARAAEIHERLAHLTSESWVGLVNLYNSLMQGVLSYLR